MKVCTRVGICAVIQLYIQQPHTHVQISRKIVKKFYFIQIVESRGSSKLPQPLNTGGDT